MLKCEGKIALSLFIFKTLNPLKKGGYSPPHAAEFRAWDASRGSYHRVEKDVCSTKVYLTQAEGCW
jgi:hypothetical protein